MAKTKTKAVSTQSQPVPLEERIRVAAYFNWLNQTNGNPVDDETTKQFWLSTEQQIADRPVPSSNGH